LEADDLARDCKLNFGQYADDDALVFNFASDAIGSEKMIPSNRSVFKSARIRLRAGRSSAMPVRRGNRLNVESH
jgi:hypothetical protein